MNIGKTSKKLVVKKVEILKTYKHIMNSNNTT